MRALGTKLKIREDMAKVGTIDCYLGIVTAVSKDESDRLEHSKEWHEILADIPGVVQGITAYPFRGDLDEPKIHDRVMIYDMDPIHHSYFQYRKVKEDDFIGFRSSGKMLNITPERIEIGVFDKDTEYKDNETPESLKSSIKQDDKGNINLKAEETIYLNGNTKPEGTKPANIVANGGTNGGLVNVEAIRQLINPISAD